MSIVSGTSSMSDSPASAFFKEFIPKSWTCLSKKYTWLSFKHDLIAGITVGLVALPLTMAFSIAAGLSPSRGLLTGIIAGFLISLLGGSRFQVGGPTGAFVVIIYDIVLRTGYEGLVITTLMAGIILLIAAFTRIGSLIKYIPYPLITGFTTGIAILIFSSQIKDFFGFSVSKMPGDFISMWVTLLHAIPSFNLYSFSVALGTLVLIILIRRFYPVLPWGITSIALSTLCVWLFGLPVDTIADRFGQIRLSLEFPDFSRMSIALAAWRTYIPDAVTIAFLAGIESLLSAIVADSMTGTKHRSNCELMGQGVANIASVLLGGIPATGAIARTATNIKTGAKTPLAGMIHAVILLVIVLLFSPLVSRIPLPALAGMLMMIAWNMSEVQHFKHLFRAPMRDVIVLLSTFLLTVLVDLTAAVEIGMILSIFLFMHRMKETSKVTSLLSLEASVSEETEESYQLSAIEKHKIPHGVEVYEITGPFFFGIADSLQAVLRNISFPPKIFILRMRKVPIIDATAMHALEEFYHQCKKEGTLLFLSGANPSVLKKLKEFGVVDLVEKKHIFSHVSQAIDYAAKLLEKGA